MSQELRLNSEEDREFPRHHHIVSASFRTGDHDGSTAHHREQPKWAVRRDRLAGALLMVEELAL